MQYQGGNAHSKNIFVSARQQTKNLVEMHIPKIYSSVQDDRQKMRTDNSLDIKYAFSGCAAQTTDRGLKELGKERSG